MKILLNILLYFTQILHQKMGGTVLYREDQIILQAPKGRHFEVPKKYNYDALRG